MKRFGNLVSAAVLGIGLFTATTQAQTNAQEIADNLRAQLSEVQITKTELKARAEQLEEDLKPENIEFSLAGVGSTHPELLRERRQRQLTVVLAGVREQLDELDLRQSRLETAIVEADAEAYWQSAGIVSNTQRRSNRP
jgi:hypothetical protein